MAPKSPLLSPAPYHILSYGTLLGTEIFQSFVGGIIAYRVLPRPSFSVLQQGTFPVYFGMQTTLPILLALTYPFSPAPSSFFSSSKPTSFLAIRHDAPASIALGVVFVLGAVNWAFVGPATTRTMRERKVQETRDGKKYYDSGTKSEGMQRLNKKFGVLHGISTLVNLGAVVATVYYGFVLGGRIR